ncbi:SPX domain-containing membrane protein [Sesamum angolense]|uniref:SPX domain-containing membrane protein n=1 Tax=Sesamum angolense TaxID=2727404 RepID=A0AAE1W9R0_9LAMI|nr:SPX domain-containing membrane protein [Sesamum angolense]
MGLIRSSWFLFWLALIWSGSEIEMVAFGKKLKERQIQEWQGYYINYKLMKKRVKQYASQIEAGALDRRHVLKDFSRMLDIQGLGAVVGAISRNLADLQDRQGSYLSIYDEPALPLQDPVVDSLKAAVDRVTYSTNFLDFLGQHALIMHEELPSPVEEHVDDHRYHFMSLLLNLVNTFLYMVNTYIIVPTADDYSMSLGAAATVCGIVIGAMAVAQIFSSVYFSAWSNKSYFRPLVFSSIVLFIGNAMYAMAYDLNSISVLLLGRVFCGLGSARAVNRRYISDCVPLKIRMQASAGFVSASALGMACGPALAGLLQTNFKIFNITFNQDTLPGWVMTVAWLIYLVWLWISFREPAHETEVNHAPTQSSAGSVVDLLHAQIRNGNSTFRIKCNHDILFGWTTSTVSIFLACLGLTVLPINIVVGSYISNMYEDRQILLASEIVVLLGILFSFHFIVPYSVPQYVCSGLVMFVAAEVLEGVNLSLLSRVMSSRLSRGTYNGGLLSTEAGTLARVIADATITLAASVSRRFPPV